MNVFRGQTALVTGGGSGLGRALCQHLAGAGAFCIVTDANGEAARRVADDINRFGGRASSAQVDVSRADEVTECVAAAVRTHGRLDYMFNNAGVIVLGEVRDTTLAHWKRVMDVNFFGVVHGTTAAYAHMVKQGRGHIINVASVAGLVHLPTYAAYSASKHAVVGFSLSLCPEAAALGINVTLVCPGPMKTGMGAAATILNASRERLERRAGKQRLMDPADAARRILAGVERRQRVIVFPFHARILWWLNRLQPTLLGPLESYFIKTLRAAREEA